MARELYITETNQNEVTVGYNFQEEKYYIKNKGYTTERTEAEEVLNTIRAIAPNISNINSPLLSLNIDHDIDNTEFLKYIQALSTTYEHLINNTIDLYYTWSDTGSHIASVQISTYENSCLILNAEKSKLYIQNSNIIFDLTLNEDDTYRARQILQYYYNTVGLDLPFYFIGCIYTTMLSYYNPFVYNSNYNKFKGIPKDKPYPYNVINPNTVDTEDINTIIYSNSYALANFSNGSPLEYLCIENPNNSVLGTTLLNSISSLTENKITLTNPPSAELHVGMTINLSHADNIIEGTSYSSDGDYIITEIDTENNIVIVDRDFPYNYTYNPPILCIRGYEQSISSINRGTREITLTNPVDNAYQIGDTIHVYGTTTTGTYGETITADGDYTVSSIGTNSQGENNPNIIIVAEDIGSNASTGTIYKDIKAGDIKEVDTTECKVVLQTCVLPTDKTLQNYVNYAIIYTEGDENYRVCIQKREQQETSREILYYVPVAELNKNISYTYAELNKLNYSQETEIEILNSINEDKLPKGKFMVDDRTEVINYLKLLPQAEQAVPTSTKDEGSLTVPTFNNLNNKVVDNIIYFDYPVNTSTGETVRVVMEFKGLYSKVFKEN